MSQAHDYWITTCAAEPVGACVLAAAMAGVPYHVVPQRSADGTKAIVKVAHGTPPPDGADVEVLGFEAWGGATETETTPAITGRSNTGYWVKRVPVDADPTWTGSEKGVAIIETDATEAHAIHLTGGLSVCPRVEVDGVMNRLIRYDGTKPPYLSAYATIYAAEVVALAATEVR